MIIYYPTHFSELICPFLKMMGHLQPPLPYFLVAAVATFSSVHDKYAGMSAVNLFHAATREQNACI